jgi:hypothetical protein
MSYFAKDPLGKGIQIFGLVLIIGSLLAVTISAIVQLSH